MPNPSDGRPALTRAALVTSLQHIGIESGDTIVVHSSLSGLGCVEGGADTVIDALLEAVGSGGTVLFPTLTGSERDGPQHPPMMDVARTPCWTGRIPETARQRPKARRSLHPTHSVVAIGAAAAAFTAGHETGNSPCDVQSPWHRLIAENGHILLLGGVTQQSNTMLHALEEQADVPYHLQPDATEGVVIGPDGRRHTVRNRLHQWGNARHFARLDAILLEEGAMRYGQVGTSQACLISAAKLASIVLPILRRDPLHLLTDAARTAFEASTQPI